MKWKLHIGLTPYMGQDGIKCGSYQAVVERNTKNGKRMEAIATMSFCGNVEQVKTCLTVPETNTFVLQARSHFQTTPPILIRPKTINRIIIEG